MLSETLKNWLIGNMGTPGDYMYQSIHWYSLAAVILSFILICGLGFDGDYMFFRSGMPFVIPGVPQFITLSVFALIVLALLSFLCDIKGSLAFLKSMRRSKIKK